jgi:hypothetical protein
VRKNEIEEENKRMQCRFFVLLDDVLFFSLFTAKKGKMTKKKRKRKGKKKQLRDDDDWRQTLIARTEQKDSIIFCLRIVPY